MRRFTTSLVATVMLSTGLVGIARGGDGHDGFNGKAESATSTDNTFVATSTAFVDPDGTQHDVDSHHDRATSPYEYQVHRFAGICPNDALGQPQDLVFVDRRLVSAGRPGERFAHT